MRAFTDTAAFWIALIALAAVLYVLPTLIGLFRGVDGLALVCLVNLIGGTALIGWPAAMILAFGPRRTPRGQVHSHPFVVRDPDRFWVPQPPGSK